MFEQIDGLLTWPDLGSAGPAEFRSPWVPQHDPYVPLHGPHVAQLRSHVPPLKPDVRHLGRPEPPKSSQRRPKRIPEGVQMETKTLNKSMSKSKSFLDSIFPQPGIPLG